MNPHALYAADLHLTSHPDDEYRWDSLEWIRVQAENRGLDAVFILGDLTDRKDEHPARLVDRLASAVLAVARHCPVVIIKGNHDYVDPTCPFFRFLDGYPNVRYFTEPGEYRIHNTRYLLVPHQTKPKDYFRDPWARGYNRILIHQPILGAVGSNGHGIEGIKPTRFEKIDPGCKVLAGDVHRPQVIGNVRYVGSPHPVHFGDEFTPRVLIEKHGEIRPVKRDCLRKVILRLSDAERLREQDLRPGDRAKVTLALPRAEFVHWDRHKARLYEVAEGMGVQLYDVRLKEKPARAVLRDPEVKPTPQFQPGPASVFAQFVALRGIDSQIADAGKLLIEDCGKKTTHKVRPTSPLRAG